MQKFGAERHRDESAVRRYPGAGDSVTCLSTRGDYLLGVWLLTPAIQATATGSDARHMVDSWGGLSRVGVMKESKPGEA